MLQTYQAGMFCECFVIAMKISGRTRIHFLSDLPSPSLSPEPAQYRNGNKTDQSQSCHSRDQHQFSPNRHQIIRSSKVKVLRITKLIACVAGARKWAQERTGAREGYTRGRGSACTKGPRKSRVSFSRARFFLRPFISQRLLRRLLN